MPKSTEAMIAFMGATGTGKSTFIRLLTNDENIRIGHDLESMTFDVATSHYIDRGARLRVTLVDTPGFDDSREGVSDTDILGKIANFLQDSGGRKLNGIIYLHRISDPRFSGTAKQNLRIFRELCGDDKLDHVRFVTTYWNIVGEKEGKDREAALANGVFKPFIDAGAKLIRHDGRFESAKKIVSDVVRKTPVRMKIQEELNAGMTLGDTSAGAVIIEEMKELKKKHESEMEELKEEVANETDENLRAELDEERRKLEERIAQVEEDRRRLATMRMNLDQQPQQDVGNPGRVVSAKRAKAPGETRQRVQKDKGPSGEQRDGYRRDEQNGGEIRTTAEVALAGGEHHEQTKQDIPSSPRPPVHDLSQETCAEPEKIQEEIRKGKAPDGNEGNNHHNDGSELPPTAQNATASEKRWERKEEIERSRRSLVHNQSQDTENVNGEWVVYCIFMISLVAVVFAVIQNE